MLAIKELLGFAKSSNDELAAIKADIVALKEAAVGTVTAAGEQIKALELKLTEAAGRESALAAEAAELKSKLEAATKERDELKAKEEGIEAEVEKRASAKAQQIVSAAGHDPVRLAPSADPAKAVGKEGTELRGLDRVVHAFRQEAQNKPQK